MLHEGKYNDDEDFWYYADGSGNLYAGEFKTIKGKKYAFRNDGRMVNGLKFIYEDPTNSVDNLIVKADDDDYYPFDNEDDFLDNAADYYEPEGFKCYYFGGSDDGAMKTGKVSIDIDGEKHNFYFEKSGSKKGAGITGEEDDKLYQSGMLLKADSDDKYTVVKKTTVYDVVNGTETKKYETYKKLDDAEEFMDDVRAEGGAVNDKYSAATSDNTVITIGHVSKKMSDLKEAYEVTYPAKTAAGQNKVEYFLVNTSGKVIDSKSKNKDGSDYYFTVNGKSGVITGLYVED